MGQGCCGNRKDAEDAQVTELIDQIKRVAPGEVTQISLFKTQMQEMRQPNQFSNRKHQGVVMVFDARTFLRMDYGLEGLSFAVTDTFPGIPNRIPWDDMNDFLTKDICGDPKGLVEVLEQTDKRTNDRYGEAFAKMVWTKFVPEEDVGPAEGVCPAPAFPERHVGSAVGAMAVQENPPYMPDLPPFVKGKKPILPEYVERGVPGQTDHLALQTRRLLSYQRWRNDDISSLPDFASDFSHGNLSQSRWRWMEKWTKSFDPTCQQCRCRWLYLTHILQKLV